MQIVSGDITRDITGEIVYLKAYKQIVGEVTEYRTSKNTATVKLCDTGPVSYTHLDVYKRQGIKTGTNTGIIQDQAGVWEKLYSFFLVKREVHDV